MHRSAPRSTPSIPAASLALLAMGALAGGCRSVECGPSTVEKVDPLTNAVQCVPAVNGAAPAIPCNVDAGARLVGGVCEGDPAQYPSCGPGTIVDEKTGACVPGMNTGTPNPPPCSKPSDPKKMCLNGVVRMLKDFTFTKGRQLEVRAYDPFAFLADPNSTPLARTTTDAFGTYILPSVEVPGLATHAVAVTDVGGPSEYLLSGSGAKEVQAGGSYQVDVFAIPKTLVSSWDLQLALGGKDTFEAHGAYVGIFVNGAYTDSPPVPGVLMTYQGTPAPDQYFFKGDRGTFDNTASATDAATGSSVQRISGTLGTYSGTGGGIMQWESGPGTSVPGVVFVQVFHPVK